MTTLPFSFSWYQSMRIFLAFVCDDACWYPPHLKFHSYSNLYKLNIPFTHIKTINSVTFLAFFYSQWIHGWLATDTKLWSTFFGVFFFTPFPFQFTWGEQKKREEGREIVSWTFICGDNILMDFPISPCVFSVFALSCAVCAHFLPMKFCKWPTFLFIYTYIDIL